MVASSRARGSTGIVASVLVVLFTLLITNAPARAADAVVLRIDGTIGPAMADYVIDGIADAAGSDAALVVIEIDTPGGLDRSMRRIVKAVLQSSVPVASYVTPRGARAASAGTYVLMASHVAAMSPGTTLGAATPVQMGASGGAREQTSQTDPPQAADGGEGAATDGESVGMKDKIINDAAAYMRALANMRGRNVEWAERAVREAATLSASEAAEIDVIDFTAEGLAALLDLADGITVSVNDREVTLETAGLPMVRADPSWRTRLLAFVTDPTVAYVLFLVGIYGIVLEFYSPGTIGPGLVGVISLLLAFYAFQVLPIDATGLALIGAGLLMIIAELFVPSFGALGILGITAFSFGSFLLYDTDMGGVGVPRTAIVVLAVSSAATFFFLMTLAARSFRRPTVSGAQQILRDEAQVVEWNDTGGLVRLEGEVWQAKADEALKPGERVEVTGRDGLTLSVSRGDTRQAHTSRAGE